MSEFPSSWSLTPLSDFCDRVVDGSHAPPKAVAVGLPMLSARNIQNREIHFDEFRFISEEDFAVENKRTNIEPGDVLLTIVGTIGRTAVVPEGLDPFTLQRSVAVLKSQFINPYYFCYALESPGLQKYLFDNAKGTAQKGIYLKALSQVEIPIAPLNEQKRIADKLDRLLAKVDNCRERLDRIPLILKRFRQSVLAAATVGILTEDWRGENNVTINDWKDKSIGEIIHNIEAGVNVKCDERPPRLNERGLVKISAVTWGVFNEQESKTLPSNHQVPELTRIKPGDFLISRANTLELVGACVIVDKVTLPVFLSDKVLRLVMDDDCKKWVLFWLRSSNGRNQIEELASGNQLSMRNLSQANLKSISLKLPSEDERQEIVRRVEKLFDFADRLEARYQNARTQIDKLTPALLDKAFKGELVPQDPTDEPAAALLAKIQPISAKPKANRKSKAN
jgi:type I restriction enzyme, S subunit